MEVISPGIIKTSEVKYSYESYFGEMKKGEKIGSPAKTCV
jgi:hypothetical protein